MSETKQIAIMSGGDWYDAGVSLLAVPADMDVLAVKKEYKGWLRDHPWVSFPDWLRKYKGAGDSSVEEYWEE